MNKKLLLVLVIGVVLSSTVATFANNQVALLTSKEADAIVGAGCSCRVKSTSCYKYQVTCVLPAQECSSACTIPGLQDARCAWQLFGLGCTTLPPVDCGAKQTGLCDENKVCRYDGTRDCGTVTNCSS